MRAVLIMAGVLVALAGGAFYAALLRQRSSSIPETNASRAPDIALHDREHLPASSPLSPSTDSRDEMPKTSPPSDLTPPRLDAQENLARRYAKELGLIEPHLSQFVTDYLDYVRAASSIRIEISGPEPAKKILDHHRAMFDARVSSYLSPEQFSALKDRMKRM